MPTDSFRQGAYRSASFTVARVQHPSRPSSIDAARVAPRGPLQPNASFSLAQAVQASVPLQSISSFDRPVFTDSSSFAMGPPARPVRGPGSFSLGAPVSAVASRSLSRGPAPPTQSRSVSRGPSFDNHRAAVTHRPVSARPHPAPRGRGTNFAMELSRDASIEVAAPFDDVMPDLGREQASRRYASNDGQRRAKKGSLFWKPPPEAAKLCAAVKMPSFVTPEVANDCRAKPPVAPVVGVTAPTWFLEERFKSYGPPPPATSFVPPLQLHPSNSFVPSFAPPARLHSGSFAPSPREMNS
jgi:hypothetical protein